MNLTPYLIRGLATGGQFALVAIGYTMVYGILKLINFAHGDLFMLSGIMMIYLAASFPTMPMWVTILIMIALTVFVGFAIEKCAYSPLRTAPRMSVMISAIGVSYLLQNLVCYVTGGLAKQFPDIPPYQPEHPRVRREGQAGGVHLPTGSGGADGHSGAYYQPHQVRYVHAGRVQGF